MDWTEWTPVRPVVVVEVAWRQASGGRFHHGVRLLRFRPDKAPEQCTFAELGAAAPGRRAPPAAQAPRGSPGTYGSGRFFAGIGNHP